MVQKRHHDDPSAIAFENSRRADVAQMSAGASRLESAVAAAVLMHADFVAMVVGVEQGGVDMLALAGAIAIAQRRQDRERAMHARTDIAERYERDVRLAVVLADHRGDAGISLRDKIVARQMRQRPALTERRNRAENDAGFDLLETIVAETHLVERAGLKIFDDYINLSDE